MKRKLQKTGKYINELHQLLNRSTHDEKKYKLKEKKKIPLMRKV